MLRKWDIPEYRVLEFFPRRSKYCVCVFVINEGERIRMQLEKMKFLSCNVDIIIADGGSSDGSLNEKYIQALGIRSLLTKIGSGKLSAQMRMAFAYVLENEYEGVVIIDGNNKDNPAAIPFFFASLEEGFDHIQGSRFILGGHEENTPLMRRIGVRFLHAPLISCVAGYHYTDTTNGFRAYSRQFLLDFRVQPFREVFQTYELHYYLAIRAGQLGFKIKEIPVSRVYPKKGMVPTKISPIKGNLRILKILLEACFHRFDPKE